MVAAAEERLAESAGIGQRPERAGEDGRVLGSLERGPAAGVVIRCSEVVSHFSLTHREPLLPRKLRRNQPQPPGASRTRPGRPPHVPGRACAGTRAGQGPFPLVVAGVGFEPT
jgi:hypothetical protein